jgi:hypothetical protein
MIFVVCVCQVGLSRYPPEAGLGGPGSVNGRQRDPGVEQSRIAGRARR